MKLAGARRIERSCFFPRNFGFKQGFKYSVVLGLGGNVGDVKTRFDRLSFKLGNDRRFHIVENSPILINAAFGYTAQSDFSNAVMIAQTSLNARFVFKITANLERRFGRKRSFKNAPRTLDIDILYFSGKNRNDERLRLPHSGAKSRLSVVLPFGLMKN